MLKRYIRVRGSYEGFHEYADAPAEVDFLKNEHRHMFKWEITLEVMHDDRELEFFMVKRQAETFINYWLRTQKWRNLGSCEMQAERILEDVQKFYGTHRLAMVNVSEDGESDGFVIYTPPKDSDFLSRLSREWQVNDRIEISKVPKDQPHRG